MVAGVHESSRTGQRAEGTARDLELLAVVIPQVIKIHQQTPRSLDEGPVQVQFISGGTEECGALAEPAVEARPWLRMAALETSASEEFDSTVDLLGANQDVEINEGPQRRIRVIQMSDRRTLEDPDVDGRLPSAGPRRRAALVRDA